MSNKHIKLFENWVLEKVDESKRESPEIGKLRMIVFGASRYLRNSIKTITEHIRTFEKMGIDEPEFIQSLQIAVEKGEDLLNSCIILSDDIDSGLLNVLKAQKIMDDVNKGKRFIDRLIKDIESIVDDGLQESVFGGVVDRIASIANRVVRIVDNLSELSEKINKSLKQIERESGIYGYQKKEK